MGPSALSSFLWLNCNILLFGHAGFYVPTHHWMGISCFPSMAIINTATITYVHTCLCWPKFVSLGNWPGSRIARSWSNSLLIGTLLSNIAPVFAFFVSETTSWKKTDSLSQQLSITNSSSSKGGALCPPPLSGLNLCLARVVQIFRHNCWLPSFSF